MPTLFDLLESESEPSVRAVLGHWLFGYIHSYPDGNGRMAHFVMNVMLTSSGYPWIVIRVEDRDVYLAALEAASIDQDINRFARFVAERVNGRWSRRREIMTDDQLDDLKYLVQKKPVVLSQFEGEKWSRLRESRRGANELTIARSHDLFETVRVPTACLVIGKDGGGSEIYSGLASSRSIVTTLESRFKVKQALDIQP